MLCSRHSKSLTSDAELGASLSTAVGEEYKGHNILFKNIFILLKSLFSKNKNLNKRIHDQFKINNKNIIFGLISILLLNNNISSSNSNNIKLNNKLMNPMVHKLIKNLSSNQNVGGSIEIFYDK